MEKRSKNNLLIVIGALVLVMVFLGIILFNTGKKPKYSWYEDYRINKDQPYSTTILHSLLQTHSPGKKFTDIKRNLEHELPESGVSSIYFFIGDVLYLDYDDAEALLSFVEAGNYAFIIANGLPDAITRPIGLNDCEYWSGYGYMLKSTIRFGFYAQDEKPDSGYAFKYVIRDHLRPYQWNYFPEEYQTCDGNNIYFPLGNIYGTDYVNFVQMPHGKGQIFIHSSPMAFSNLNLLDKQGFEYVSKALGYLPHGDIYWDEFSKIPSSSFANSDDDNSRPESPLAYILGETSLRWSWYLLLAMMLLFILFRSKRRQRVIKVVEPNVNTSLEFVETIGTLYYQQNDHKKLIEQKMKYFLAYIRSRYQLNTGNLNDELVSQIARRAELDKLKVQKIINLYMAAQNSPNVSDELLTDLHYSLNYFYKNSK